MSWHTTSLAGLSVLAAIAICPAALAQEAGTETTADGIRRDPAGVTGISPFWEAIREGDRAYVARSYPAAIDAYKKAITAEPNNPMGHYRAGQAHMANSQMREAEQAYVAALRYAVNDPQLMAKVLFVIADLRERQQDYNGAVERWDAYAAHLKQGEIAASYPGTPEDRKRVIARWQELRVQYAEVKERIARREKEADDKLKKEAK